MIIKFPRYNKDICARKQYLEISTRNINFQILLKRKAKSKIKLLTKKPSFLVNNFCSLTGVARVYRKFSLSRHMLRRYLNRGYFPHITPSSW